MRLRAPVLVWLISPVLMAGAVSAAPATMPASRPTTGPVLPPEFDVFQSRSAFFSSVHKPPATSGPESTLVLRGVIRIDDRFTAIIENTAGGKDVIQASVGDAVGSGKVKSIDLDAMGYKSAGQTKQIAVGQNLNGEVVAAPAPASRPAGPPPESADAPPPDGGQPAPPQPGSKSRRNK